MDELRRARLALDRCRALSAPDDRVTVFEVEVDADTDQLALTGVVFDEQLATAARESVEEVADRPVTSDLDVLEEAATRRAIGTPQLDCRGAPTADGERVTELLYGQSVRVFDRRGDWRRIRTPDGYLAWVREHGLVDHVEIAVDSWVTRPIDDSSHQSATAKRDAGLPVSPLYPGVPCEIRSRDDGRCAVRFATGDQTSLPADWLADPPDRPTGESIVAAAETYLGTEYRWGGMTTDGIDCSGLVWQAYQQHGIGLPRDADQQRAMGDPVQRDALAPGDLLFFPGHVAISTGGSGLVHAADSAGGVVYATLDPAGEPRTEQSRDQFAGYDQHLDETFACARRLLSVNRR